MVYTVLNGRLGNILFQVAAGASLAKRNNTDYVAQCQDGYLLGPPDNCFVSDYVKQFQDNILQKVKIEKSQPCDYWHYNEPKFGYQEIPYHDNIRIKGWFQSEKYFDKELIQELFKVPTQIEEYILNKYGHLFEGEGINSIHVRRGDYLKIPHLYRVGSMNYYKKGIKYLGKDRPYLVVSDDMEWCKKNFKGKNFIFGDDEEPLVDMYLQSFCKNNIIANSSFSWWAAWLNTNPNKQVICPTPWFGKRYSEKERGDLIPTSWIRLPNRMSLGLSVRAFFLYNKEQFVKFAGKILPQSLKDKIRR